MGHNTHTFSERAIGIVVLFGFAVLILGIGIDSRTLKLVREQVAVECSRSDALRHARDRYRVSGTVTIREINRSGTTCQASFVFEFGSYADADVVYWTP